MTSPIPRMGSTRAVPSIGQGRASTLTAASMRTICAVGPLGWSTLRTSTRAGDHRDDHEVTGVLDGAADHAAEERPGEEERAQ
ncbi:MAG: hypothetical protein M5U28_17700 [Sandaracinaceae bacterium]|nr:hypothetical protein [Sandaracinaceae bacterium]